MTGDATEPPTGGEPVTFTDPDLEFLRHARFGELPPRVRPADLIGLIETEPRRDWPYEGLSRDQSDILRSGG